MLTTDDLKKIRGIMREEISGSETKIHGEFTSLETKMENRFNAVEKRFEGIDKRFDSVDKHFEKIEAQMDQDRKDWSDFFNHAGIFFDEMRIQLSKRIKKLEDKQGFSKN